MWSYFKDIYASAKDDDPASVRLLRAVLMVATVSILGIAILLSVINRGKISVGVIGAIVIAILSGAALYFSYRNIHWPGRLLFPATVLAGLTFLAISIDGLHDSSIAGFTLVIIFTSLLIGQKIIPLSTVLTLLAIWVIAYADITGINRSMFAQATKEGDAIGLAAVISFIQIIAAVSLNGLMSRLNYAIDISRKSEQAQISANQELRELQITLEQRVVDRTAVAEAARVEAEAARKDLEAQFWLATGQTQLMDVMRGEQTITQLAENVLSHLCRYTDVQAGALFLLEDQKVKLIGTYAYTARSGFDGSFALGEGLVGQAAVDGKIIYQNVPSDTLVISTGLGELKPRQIAAAPFHMNEKVVGVLELATLSEFTANHLELWNRVSETLGFAFYTVQTRQKLSELLTASQQQAEELQAQEEELRAANEELQAQAENLKAVREKNPAEGEKYGNR